MLRSIDEIVAKAKGFPRVYVIGPQITLVSSENTGKIWGAKTGEARIVVVISWMVTVNQGAVRQGSTNTKEKFTVLL